MMAEMGSAYRKGRGRDLFVDEPQRRAALCVYRHLYVVFLLCGVDGQHRGEKFGSLFRPFSSARIKTQSWAFAGLTSTQTVGVLAACWMVLVTLVAAKGINKIAKITAVGGIAVMCLNLVLLLVSGAILLLNGGHFAQSLDFTASPNPGYQSGLAMLSFVVFAIFAYGGIEAVGGLVDKNREAGKELLPKVLLSPRW